MWADGGVPDFVAKHLVVRIRAATIESEQGRRLERHADIQVWSDRGGDDGPGTTLDSVVCSAIVWGLNATVIIAISIAAVPT
jgi:hypothetical protein